MKEHKCIMELESDSKTKILETIGFIRDMKEKSITKMKLYAYNTDKNKYEQINKKELRHLLILSYLSSTGTTEYKKVAQEFSEYSKPTIYDDLKYLEEEGRIDVKEESKRKKFVHYEEKESQ